jgi:Zn-dependent oligopeptidase
MLLGTEYAVDQEEIKKYFSLESTIKSKYLILYDKTRDIDLSLEMLDIYEKVLGLHFVKVPAKKAVVWHPDVQLYECWDAVEDKSFSGYMYLDLFPRDNKCKQFSTLFIHKKNLLPFM